jgi:hypothetical protein
LTAKKFAFSKEGKKARRLKALWFRARVRVLFERACERWSARRIESLTQTTRGGQYRNARGENIFAAGKQGRSVEPQMNADERG